MGLQNALKNTASVYLFLKHLTFWRELSIGLSYDIWNDFNVPSKLPCVDQSNKAHKSFNLFWTGVPVHKSYIDNSR